MEHETVADRYRRLAGAFAATISEVPSGAWDNPSPCEGWTARDVVRHVVDTQGLFLGLVGRSRREGPPVDTDPAGAWAFASAQVQADLDDPEAAAAEFDGFFGRTSFATAVDRFVCFDLVVHRWDLAEAAGLDTTIPEQDVRFVMEGTKVFGDALRSNGVCGPALEAPDGADEQTRMLAFLGRRA